MSLNIRLRGKFGMNLALFDILAAVVMLPNVVERTYMYMLNSKQIFPGWNTIIHHKIYTPLRAGQYVTHQVF